MRRLCLWDRGQPGEGKVVCALRDSFLTLFVGSLSLLLGWEASCSENTCGEGGGVTRACGPQPREISRSRVCVPALRVSEWPCGAMLGRRQGDKCGAEQGQHAGGLGVIRWPGESLCGVCALAARWPAQRVRVTGRRGLAAAWKQLGQSGSLVMFT